MDVFDGQRQLNSPVENLRIDDELCSWFRNNFSDLTGHCFVSLRETTSDRARNLSNSLDCGFAVFPTTFFDSESDSGEMGAKAVYAVCIHGAFTEDGLGRISDSSIITVVTTNSIDQSENIKKCPKLRCLDVSNRFAAAIARIHNSTSENHVTGSDDTTPLNGDNVT
ncbi:Ribose-phosphate pyrophosphokinase 2 [Sparganum proliferum]